MEIAANCPMEDIGIGGVEGLKIPVPIEKGHVCTENEAHALNQLLKENTRNNLRDRMKKLKDEGGDMAACQALLDEYLKSYDFGKPGGGGGRTTDPVMAEAIDSAKKLIRKALVAKGHKLSSYSAQDMTNKAKALIERRPELLKQAKKAVENREKDMDAILDDVEA